MFNFIKEALSKVYSQFTSKVQSLFARNTIDKETLKELEQLLISADTGVKTTSKILNSLEQSWQKGAIAKGSDLQQALEQQLITLLDTKQAPAECQVYVLVGINGSGKTTFAGKLAHQKTQEGKKVLLVAGDTFRAAATQQLIEWAHRAHSQIVVGKENQDPASVIFQACEPFKQQNYDTLIIDTAGRLQTKTNLMKELEKIKKIINRQLPDYSVCTLLTVDSMLGQNSFEQAKIFNESTNLDGIVLTKMDGTGKGGIVFSIVQELHIPVAYISYGESIDQLKPFNAHEYVKQLIGE